jgi:hypothetical protein
MIYDTIYDIRYTIYDIRYKIRYDVRYDMLDIWDRIYLLMEKCDMLDMLVLSDIPLSDRTL